MRAARSYVEAPALAQRACWRQGPDCLFVPCWTSLAGPASARALVTTRRMKNPIRNLVASLSFFASGASVLGQGVLLGPGQSYTFEFTSLAYLRPAQTDNGSLTAYFAPGTFSDGESMLLEIFANTLS